MSGRRFGLPSVDLLADFWNHPLDYEASSTDRRRPTVPGRTLTIVVIIVIGLLLAVAWRDSMSSQPADAQARVELRDDIAAQQQDNAMLTDMADKLRIEVNELRDEVLGNQAAVEQLHADEAAAGLRAVTGDGVVVTIADGPRPENDNGSHLGEVFDRDLHLIVNTLWALGAEAIAIDDQRLTAVTTIRSAGDVILVDFAPVGSPYQIAAIGPPDLTENFEASSTAETFREYESDYGISLTVEATGDLLLPASSYPALDEATPKGSN